MIAGYHTARPSERAAFGMLSSCAVSIGAARTINYSRERRRRFPWLRGWARRIYHAPGRERIRVHHFIPGIALAFVSGAGSILKREDGLEFWLGIAFGTGVGLTLDEAAVLTELDNPYWESQRFALANAAVAALGAGFLGHRFYRHQIGRLPSDRST
jgi:hypothetical protein